VSDRADTLSSADPPVLSGESPKVTRFLDIGTGSGILAIAAAKLWPASRGLAIDIDPVAVEVATENAQRNGVAGRVSCAPTPLGAVQERFDLVMANIQMDVLRSLRDAVVQRIAPGGILILSGLLDEEARDVARWYALLPGIQTLRLRQCADDPEGAPRSSTRRRLRREAGSLHPSCCEVRAGLIGESSAPACREALPSSCPGPGPSSLATYTPTVSRASAVSSLA
jgi:precorrin-6B methylase 2